MDLECAGSNDVVFTVNLEALLAVITVAVGNPQREGDKSSEARENISLCIKSQSDWESDGESREMSSR